MENEIGAVAEQILRQASAATEATTRLRRALIHLTSLDPEALYARDQGLCDQLLRWHAALDAARHASPEEAERVLVQLSDFAHRMLRTT